MMSLAIIRFFSKGWIEDFYAKPAYFFSYYGFEWAKPPPLPYLYAIYCLLLILSLMIMAGLFFRLSIISFFLLFTYTELWDKTVYLNHYYLISLLAFLMSFLPMNAVAALDCLRRSPTYRLPKFPLESDLLLKIQIGSVYFFGGIAKIGYDWLFLGQPLKIWLSANSDLPFIGHLLTLEPVAIAISWFAMLFDLSAPFLLYSAKTRPFIYPVVILFHLLTALFFPIGMFPWFMSVFTLIYFSPQWHRRIMNFVFKSDRFCPEVTFMRRTVYSQFLFLGLFFLFQLLMPFRAWLYPGNPLWHEQGFRFSWRIMLMEKNGSTEYLVKSVETGKTFTVHPSEFLTRRQVIQMSFQPDMILQFAHHLHDHYLKEGLGETEIRAVSYASLNGKGSRLLVDGEIDLAKQKEGWQHKNWITPSP
jgi:hypothetical protein